MESLYNSIFPVGEGICNIENSSGEQCRYNCRGFLMHNPWANSLMENCHADQKLNDFLEGKTSFHTALTAFISAPPKVIEKLLDKNEFIELAAYFFSILDENTSVELSEGISDKYLYPILRLEFDNFYKFYKGSTIEPTNFFDLKGNRFWKKLNQLKIQKLIEYCVRTQEDSRMAAQLLTLLPVEEIILLAKKINLSKEEELRIFIALDDEICNLARCNPYLFEYLMDLFKDEIGFVEIFTQFIEEAEVSKRIDRYVEEIIREISLSNKKLSLQWLYNELKGIPKEDIESILNSLSNKQIITENERTYMADIFIYSGIDIEESFRRSMLYLFK